MTAGDFDVIGATLPGAPAVAIGRNRFIAWGETNVAADVEDLYLERIDPSGKTAEFRGAQEPIRIIPETITVKGAAPIHLDVRVTRHGPLVSDALNAISAAAKTDPKPPTYEPLAFRWTALDDEDSTVVAFLKLNDAHNWDEFSAALRHFVTPAQNFVYADIEGHIGYYAPGRIPVRASGDGSQPVEGWTGDSEWVGSVPFEDLPHLIRPSISSSQQNRPMPPTILTSSHSSIGSVSCPTGHGSHRAEANFMVSDFAVIRRHSRSTQALLPLLLRHVGRRCAHGQGRSLLGCGISRDWRWCGLSDLSKWFHHLAPAIVGDELGHR
jgi:penicillin amidase